MTDDTGVRKVGSYLIILVFLTAYGRCMTDQLGMLHASNIACCQTICENLTEENTTKPCDDCPDLLEADPDETNATGKHEVPETPKVPTPCQLCFILDSDSMLVEHGIKLPAPVFYELAKPLGLISSTDDVLHALRFYILEELLPTEHCAAVIDHRSLPLRLRIKTTPVRGPSIA